MRSLVGKMDIGSGIMNIDGWTNNVSNLILYLKKYMSYV